MEVVLSLIYFVGVWWKFQDEYELELREADKLGVNYKQKKTEVRGKSFFFFLFVQKQLDSHCLLIAVGFSFCDQWALARSDFIRLYLTRSTQRD